jgi:hypothetical protein
MCSVHRELKKFIPDSSGIKLSQEFFVCTANSMCLELRGENSFFVNIDISDVLSPIQFLAYLNVPPVV